MGISATLYDTPIISQKKTKKREYAWNFQLFFVILRQMFLWNSYQQTINKQFARSKGRK